jgi:hypothetical protein
MRFIDSSCFAELNTPGPYGATGAARRRLQPKNLGKIHS